MEIDKEFRKETVWKIKLSEKKTLVLTAIEDTIQPEPTVTFTVVDAEKNTRVSVDLTKDKFLNMSEVFDSFGQVCLGVEPVFSEEMLGPAIASTPISEPKPEVKAEPRPEPKPEPKLEAKPAPKPEPVVAASAKPVAVEKPIEKLVEKPIEKPVEAPPVPKLQAAPDAAGEKKAIPIQKPIPPILPSGLATQASKATSGPTPSQLPAVQSMPTSTVRWPPRFPKLDDDLDDDDVAPTIIPGPEDDVVPEKPKDEPKEPSPSPKEMSPTPKPLPAKDDTPEWDPW